MRLSSVVELPPTDNPDFMNVISCFVDLEDPKSGSLDIFFSMRSGIIPSIEEHYGVKIELETDEYEVCLIVLTDDLSKSNITEHIVSSLLKILVENDFKVLTKGVTYQAVLIEEPEEPSFHTDVDLSKLN